MFPLTSPCIGIIADSHGNPDMIASAVDFFHSRGCARIIHLGDICDSFRPDTCDPCIRILKKNNIAAVKGNNDHVLEINQSPQPDSIISKESLSFLQNLPPTLTCDNLIFAHSLPFFEDLGISCITKIMGEPEIRKFFSQPDYSILFRGHNHAPEIVWKQGQGIGSLELPPGESIDLKQHLPCIVTCGALTRGLVMILDSESFFLTSHSIKKTVHKNG
jgi:predicted phosphodiesterase